MARVLSTAENVIAVSIYDGGTTSRNGVACLAVWSRSKLAASGRQRRREWCRLVSASYVHVAGTATFNAHQAFKWVEFWSHFFGRCTLSFFRASCRSLSGRLFRLNVPVNVWNVSPYTHDTRLTECASWNAGFNHSVRPGTRQLWSRWDMRDIPELFASGQRIQRNTSKRPLLGAPIHLSLSGAILAPTDIFLGTVFTKMFTSSWAEESVERHSLRFDLTGNWKIKLFKWMNHLMLCT